MAEKKSKPKPKAPSSGRLPFPQRVYNVLKLTEENHQEHVLSWVKDGTAFKVHDLEAFERDFLPRYFNTQKYASFTRTLCAYGFDCKRTGRQTGIYSHPKFTRDNTSALSQIKRASKNNKTAPKAGVSRRKSSDDVALKSRLSSMKYGIRDGNRTVMFPSLLDSPSAVSKQDGNSSGFGQLYQTIRSQVADRATKLLVRLPPGVELISPYDSENDSVYPPSSPSPILESPSSVSQPKPFHMAGTTFSDMSGQQNREAQVAENDASILDDSLGGIPHSLLGDDECDDDFEPIPWSPQQNPLHDDDGFALDQSGDRVLSSSLEPRTIQEMNENPGDLNLWYRALPTFPQPRYQALYDYSSPIALPGLFYCMDISAFGIYWSIFLIAGHTIQALFTDYGPNTSNLVWSPQIGLLKHLFMDIIWVHSLLSAMILVPEYFGTSSVMLATAFLSSNPPSLGTSLKSHYQLRRQNFLPYIHGDWWISDIIRWLFWGYSLSVLCVCHGHFFGIGDLKVIGVFLMNLTPLFICQSYRLLLSIPATGLQHQHGDKKHN